jgi:hypothetical protein
LSAGCPLLSGVFFGDLLQFPEEGFREFRSRHRSPLDLLRAHTVNRQALDGRIGAATQGEEQRGDGDHVGTTESPLLFLAKHLDLP